VGYLCGDMLCWLLNCVERWWCRGWGEKELLPCRLLMATRFWRYVLVCKWYLAQLTAPLIIPQLWRKPAVTNLIMYVCLHSSPLFPLVQLSTCYKITRLWDSWVDCGVVVRIYIYICSCTCGFSVALIHTLQVSGPHTLMSSLGWIPLPQPLQPPLYLHWKVCVP
jgi:hypothetical protein